VPRGVRPRGGRYRSRRRRLGADPTNPTRTDRAVSSSCRSGCADRRRRTAPGPRFASPSARPPDGWVAFRSRRRPRMRTGCRWRSSPDPPTGSTTPRPPSAGRARPALTTSTSASGPTARRGRTAQRASFGRRTTTTARRRAEAGAARPVAPSAPFSPPVVSSSLPSRRRGRGTSRYPWHRKSGDATDTTTTGGVDAGMRSKRCGAGRRIPVLNRTPPTLSAASSLPESASRRGGRPRRAEGTGETRAPSPVLLVLIADPPSSPCPPWRTRTPSPWPSSSRRAGPWTSSTWTACCP